MNEAMQSAFAVALRPASAKPAVASAIRTLIVAGAVLLTGALIGDLQAVGVAFLGTAFAVAFVQTRTYRSVATALIGQAAGAVLGFGISAVSPSTPVAFVVTATAAAVISGMVGSLGPAAPGFGMMLSIGLAYGQFGHSPLPWWELCSWYLLGTAAVGAVWLWPRLFDTGSDSRSAAAVFDASADLCEAIGSRNADQNRARLAAAWAGARSGRRNAHSDLAGFAAATLYAEGAVVPAAAVAALRQAAEQVRSGQFSAVTLKLDASTPGLVALADALSDVPSRLPGPAEPPFRIRMVAALRSLRSREVLDAGARLGVCMGVATAASVALHGTSHSFWLPLTVAVIMRPEYASIFVRTVNRVTGTVVGAASAAAIVALAPDSVWVAIGAAAALAVSVLLAPKLYAFSVVGLTTAALLSSSIGSVDDILPLVRLLDTAIGALIAVVIGYVLWPNARRFSGIERVHQAADAASVYLRAAVGGSSPALQQPRDTAYRLAHSAREIAERAFAEPPPVNRVALQHLPDTIALERVLDDITRVVATVDAGGSVDEDVRCLGERIALIGAKESG